LNHFVKRRIFHAKAGARGRKRNGVYYRSTWEFCFALVCEERKRRGEIEDWSYEKHEFEFKGIKRGTRFYRPDFWIKESSGREYFVEIKGFLDSKSVTALSRMAKYYPEVTILILDKSRYAELESEFGNLEGWER